jgi:hypothetical protein
MFDILDTMGGAVKDSFETTQKALGYETDPDLKLYDSLKKPQVDQIRAKYGVRGLSKYALAMEAKRLGVK